MITIVDYGVGNLFSLKSSFSAISEQVCIASTPEQVEKAEKILLPGVGAFSDAIAKLRQSGLDRVLIQKANEGTPLLGICLGMQLLFDESFEYGVHKGLGLIPGQVRPIEERIPKGYKIPHIGWNRLDFQKPSQLFRHIQSGDFVYFVHSYSATDCDGFIGATTDYGCSLTASVEKENVYGCQFHPEKSGNVGLNILKAFAEL